MTPPPLHLKLFRKFIRFGAAILPSGLKDLGYFSWNVVVNLEFSGIEDLHLFIIHFFWRFLSWFWKGTKPAKFATNKPFLAKVSSFRNFWRIVFKSSFWLGLRCGNIGQVFKWRNPGLNQCQLLQSQSACVSFLVLCNSTIFSCFEAEIVSF